MNSEFAKKLKNLRNEYGYTQKELSNILGIKQTTISNYEKGLRFPDIDKLKKISNLFEVSIDELIGVQDNLIIEEKINYDLIKKEGYKKFLEYLLKGYKIEAREFIINIYNSGVDIKWIYLNILEKTLKEVGRLWENGEIDVWNEHYVSENILDIMRELKSYEKNKEYKDISMICFTAGSEQHNIGIKMIADLLEIDGYKVIYLGSNIPTLSIISAIKNKKPKFVAISVTLTSHIESAKSIIKAIKSSFKSKAPKIIVGGGAFMNINNVCKEINSDYYCETLEDIKVLIDK